MARATLNQCYTGGYMANLTIAIDDDLLRQARVRAVQEGTSVNQVLRAQLELYARQRTRYAVLTRRVLERAVATDAGSGGRRWTRDELHDRG